MKIRELLALRLANQRLEGAQLDEPEDVVAWLGAVQSQERVIAPWSIAQRTTSGAGSAVQNALADGSVIRTHALRPTWHYLARPDFRWIMDATAPRVHRMNSTYYKRMGLDADVVAKGRQVIEHALADGAYLARPELDAALEESGIAAGGFRHALIVMQAELDQVICSGPPRGKIHTYALVDERVPPSPSLPRDEALAGLASRYFQSHGPATVRDFVWWSSLTVGDARKAIQAAGLAKVDVEGVEHWAADAAALGSESVRSARVGSASGPRAHLLQTYDEYIVAYKDTRHALADAEAGGKARMSFIQPLIYDGLKVGTWRAVERKRALSVEVRLDGRKTAKLGKAIDEAVARFGAYSGKSVEWREAT
jgi:hypothetical protein